MKNLKFGLIGLLLIIIGLVPLGCSGRGGDDPVDPPVKTISWEDDGTGFIQYYTNDLNNLGTDKIYTYNTSVTMNTFKAQCKKNSGQSGQGYGFFFCFQDTDNFYRILITTEGKYNIYKKVGDSLFCIKDWDASLSLNTGYKTPNTIEISRSDNTFSIYFNDKFETTFIDASFSGGKYGFFVAIGTTEAMEIFPKTPVDVRFKLISFS